VIGPAATIAEADHLISERSPDLALVDFNLRGELATGLIDRLHGRGIPVIVTTGYAEIPLAPGRAAAVLRKPVRMAELLAAAGPVITPGLASQRSAS
jgi:DNA-binding NtrC family response regulator